MAKTAMSAAMSALVKKKKAALALAPAVSDHRGIVRQGETMPTIQNFLGPSAAAITGQDIAICGGSSLPL